MNEVDIIDYQTSMMLYKTDINQPSTMQCKSMQIIRHRNERKSRIQSLRKKSIG